MKSSEYNKSIQGKSVDQLKTELADLRKEQFNLRIQGALGQQVKGHLVRQARKNIARIKTLMNQKASAK
jgi:large subunit ribosomal protein L29